MTTRHESRTIAFKFLYGNLPDGKSSGATAVEYSRQQFEGFCDSFEFKFDDYAWEVCQGTGQNLPALDEKIAFQAANWRLERMAKVDLTILRLATYELLFRKDIPRKVALDEAVELAKEYGEKDSPAFVNGLLDKLSNA